MKGLTKGKILEKNKKERESSISRRLLVLDYLNFYLYIDSTHFMNNSKGVTNHENLTSKNKIDQKLLKNVLYIFMNCSLRK